MTVLLTVPSHAFSIQHYARCEAAKFGRSGVEPQMSGGSLLEAGQINDGAM